MSSSRPKASSVRTTPLSLQDLHLPEENVNEFWDGVQEGQDRAPLIEDMPGDANYKKVTFLYRSKKTNQDIRLNCNDLNEYTRFQEEQNNFKQIPYTDIYYLQVENIPADAYAKYNLTVNAEELPTRDLILPNASRPKWHDLPTTSNSKHSEEFSRPHIDKYFGERPIYINKPTNFDPTTGKVLFVTDGEDFHRILTPYLDSLRDSPEYRNTFANTAIVFVGTSKCENRGDQLKVPPFLTRVQEFYFDQDKFSELMVNDIMPRYCDKLKIPKDKQKNASILVGHSLGAYNALNAALKHPESIGGVILESAALNQMNRASTIDPMISTANAKKNNIPIYMEIGTLETVTPPLDWQGHIEDSGREYTDESRWEANNAVHAQLESAGYSVEKNLRQFSSGHNALNIIGGITNGLRHIQLKQKETLSKTKAEEKESILSTTTLVAKRMQIEPSAILYFEESQVQESKKNEFRPIEPSDKVLLKGVDVTDEKIPKNDFDQASDTAKLLRR